ncbi:DUF1648 domain-containing protein [Corynebacterium liangguodongii]|uniref:DUF1648 domain-containing protein n=1 Tax=Corynebacterium liangguodongii TaxID=2079535 RepID=A0A2S0WBH0_9CORY|nr:DUF1648 domain-containing protein [Corynebacterium liangguodongii]AWB83111.1 hypothetical protein C3E79_00245 [Corynebacterium liangguodongii]PWB99288.1 DUF1648 domain-containing protein [Corynebacterium liangguodongii]
MDRYLELHDVPKGWLPATYAFIAGCAALLVVGWNHIPDPLPTHWGFGGPDAWTEKTPQAVFGQFAIAAVPLGLLTPLVTFLTHQQAKTAHEGFPRRSVAEVNRARATSNELVPVIQKNLCGITGVVVGTLTASLLGWSGPSATIVTITLIICVVVCFALDVRAANWHINAVAGESELSRHMAWGMFYYNPEDRRVMVDHAMGATLNFARRGAWVFLGLILSPAALVILVMLFTR